MEQIYYVVTSAGRKNHKSTINNRFFVFLLFIFFDGYCKLMEEYIINFQIIIDNKPNKNKKQTHTKIYGWYHIFYARLKDGVNNERRRI